MLACGNILTKETNVFSLRCLHVGTWRQRLIIAFSNIFRIYRFAYKRHVFDITRIGLHVFFSKQIKSILFVNTDIGKGQINW